MNKAVLKNFMNQKQTRSKLDGVEYSRLEPQPYLTSNNMNNTQKELLFNWSSNCHKLKSNFKKLYKNNIQCSLGCPQVEDQHHTFVTCEKYQTNFLMSFMKTYLEH